MHFAPFFQKLTPSTSYKGATVTSNHQPTEKLEAPVNRGLVNRVKDMFARNEDYESSADTRGNEWLLANDVEINDTNMHSEPTDTNTAFGEQKCNNTTEVR